MNIKEFFHVDSPAYTVIMLAMFISATAVIINPIGLPVVVNQYTIAAQSTVATVQAGQAVVINFYPSATSYLNVKPGTDAIVYQLIQQKAKILFTVLYPGVSGGGDSYQQMLRLVATAQPTLDAAGYKYGTDYAIFPFVAGSENLEKTFAQDVWGALKVDNVGTPVANLPVMANLKKITDFALYVSANPSFDQPAVRQFYLPYKTKIVQVIVSTALADCINQWKAGNIAGFIQDLRGGAEYEKIVGRPAYGLQMMDALNITNLVCIAAIFVGIGSYWGKRLTGSADRVIGSTAGTTAGRK